MAIKYTTHEKGIKVQNKPHLVLVKIIFTFPCHSHWIFFTFFFRSSELKEDFGLIFLFTFFLKILNSCILIFFLDVGMDLFPFESISSIIIAHTHVLHSLFRFFYFFEYKGVLYFKGSLIETFFGWLNSIRHIATYTGMKWNEYIL